MLTSNKLKTRLTSRRWVLGLRGVKVEQGCPFILFSSNIQAHPSAGVWPCFPSQTRRKRQVKGPRSNQPLQTQRRDFLTSPYQTSTCRGYLYDKATFVAFSWVNREAWMKRKCSGWWPRGQRVEGSSWSPLHPHWPIPHPAHCTRRVSIVPPRH